MLANSKLQTIIWTANVDRAEQFYSNVLGLPLVGRSHGALIYKVSDGELRVSPVLSTSPTEHTVLGFAVADLRDVVKQLGLRGVEMERFPQFPQDEHLILNIPGGDQVGWFRDPDGNLLSVVQYAADNEAFDRNHHAG